VGGRLHGAGRAPFRTFDTKKEAAAFAWVSSSIGNQSPTVIGSDFKPLVYRTPLPCRLRKGERNSARRQGVVDSIKNSSPKITPTCGDVIVHILAEVPRAHAVADVDNLLKPVLDAMIGIVYQDDTQIIECLIKKIPSTKSGLTIKVWRQEPLQRRPWMKDAPQISLQ
jgi:Holliday junction resolvase RusA-like endonuclease